MSQILPYPGAVPGSTGVGTSSNPWFTIANQFVPRNLHDVIKWARYITIQSPTTSEVIRKLSTYPITDFNFDTTKDSVKEKYKAIAKSFKLKENLQNVGFEYFTIGNVFVSIYFPIHRSVKCPICSTSWSLKKAKHITFKQYKFVGKCPNCNTQGEHIREDTKSISINDMNLIKWTPENIAVNHNPITGESEYYYKIPNIVKTKVQRGDPLFINTLPWEFVEAIRNNQDFKFDRDNIFHLKNVTTGGTVDGVSVPPLLSLFYLVFYQATLRKANEAIATEYLNPLRIVFPQPSGTGQADPVISMSLRAFVSNMEAALLRHKQDKNHIVIAPTPVGYQTIGGEGKNLLVSQEIQQAEETILLSLGVSRELLSGLTNWTSSSVGLRMMENLLFSYTSRLQELIDWLVLKVASYLNVEVIPVTLVPFKLVDDDILKNGMQVMNAAGKVSDTSVFESLGMDFNKEQERIKSEMVHRAKMEIQAKYEVEEAQFVAAKDKGEAMRDNDEFKALITKAQGFAGQLYQADPNTQREFLNSLKTEDYAMFIMVTKMLEESAGQDQAAMAGAEQAEQGAEQGQEGQGQPAEQGSQNPFAQADDKAPTTKPKAKAKPADKKEGSK